MNEQDTSQPIELNKTRVAAAALATGGVLLALITFGWALASYAEASRAAVFSVAVFLGTTALLFAGVAGGLLLWGIAEVLRKLDSLIAALRDARPPSVSETMLYGVPFRSEATSAAPEGLGGALQELVTLTRELRDVSLLSERERAARLQILGQAMVRQLQQEIPALLHEHKWVDARQRVEHARARFPTFADWDGFDQQIETVRASVEARDLENATRQVNDLAALGAWDRVVAVVRELLDRHPQSAKAQELARRVNVQREKADAEQRARLMAQAQEAANQRDWNRALGIANDVIRRFPRSPEAEALRQQMPTLVENAEIQTRHQMEAEFRELMKQHRHEDALRLARELIQRYPNSPQAEVLREQLPRLEERSAAGQAARRA